MTKRVWILGAGFSRSLGAPLLNDLLSFRLRSRLVGLRGATKAVDSVYALYHYGMDFPEGYAFTPGTSTPDGEKGCWRDAEHFLEFLDRCVADGEMGNGRLEAIRMRMYDCCYPGDMLDPRLDKTLARAAREPLNASTLVNAAKKIIAAEVCEFLKHPSEERLNPYQRWLASLKGDDTIITFNYDCLLEKLVAEPTHQWRPKLSVLCAEEPKEGCAQLIKLHGSVDWKRIPDELLENESLGIPFKRSGDLEYAVAHPGDGQILTPGGSKMASAEDELSVLWAMASESIRDAEQLYIIGYRIPESDAKAREMILDAIADSDNYTPAKIVLGPPSFDRERIKLMLGLAGREADPLEATAEDFLQTLASQQRREWRMNQPRQPPSPSAHPSHPSTRTASEQGPQSTSDGSSTAPPVQESTEPEVQHSDRSPRENPPDPPEAEDQDEDPKR